MGIHIYYDDIKIEEVSQEAAYDWSSFIGELGGIGDLFVGFSFFTLFQLIEIFIAYMARCIQRKHRERRDRKEKEKAARSDNIVMNELANAGPPDDSNKASDSGPSQVGLKTEDVIDEPVYELSNF